MRIAVGLLTLLLSGLVIKHGVAATSFSFQHYDLKNNQLFMNLVTPTVKANVFLRVGEKMLELEGAQLVDLFLLRVHVPCEKLVSGATLYWAAYGQPDISAPIPPQACQVFQDELPAIVPVKIFEKQGLCWIDVGDNTLWRTATEVSRFNKATVYQNVYALFLANRSAFVNEDVNRLKAHILRCPSDQLVASISPENAYRLFNEMLEFNNVR